MKRQTLVVLLVLLTVAFGAGAATLHVEETVPENTGGDAVRLSVVPVQTAVPADETTAFAALTPAQQRVFEYALPGGYVEVTHDAVETMGLREGHVRYRNTTYRVVVATA
ncbi:hypothetical protein [Halarchaeum sp. P4]|uniref:hypothetical protein n=1 Tax=Halarchaeum sp. P4 TaxID=3421639 RepID=UPI003EB6FA48